MLDDSRRPMIRLYIQVVGSLAEKPMRLTILAVIRIHQAAVSEIFCLLRC